MCFSAPRVCVYFHLVNEGFNEVTLLRSIQNYFNLLAAWVDLTYMRNIMSISYICPDVVEGKSLDILEVRLSVIH